MWTMDSQEQLNIFFLIFITFIINNIIGILNNKMDIFVMWSAHLNIMKQITQTNYNKIKLIYHLRILKQLQKKQSCFFILFMSISLQLCFSIKEKLYLDGIFK